MRGSLTILTLVIASTLLAACGEPQPNIQVMVSYECDDSNCEVVVDINNPGSDSHMVEYDFSAYTSDSTLLGKLDESFEVPGNYEATITRLVPVTSEPKFITSGTGTTRL